MKRNVFSFILILMAGIVFAEAKFNIKDNSVLESRTVDLSGNWDFYWGRFINPEAPYKESDLEVEVPSSWNHYDLAPVEKACAENGTGAGTYRLHVCNLKPKTQYSFTTYGIGYTSFKCFVNGELIHQAGEPDVKWENTQLQQYMDIVSFTSDENGDAVFVIWMSNKEYRRGGFRGKIKIQESSHFYEGFHNDLAYFSILAGILLAIFLYSLMLFLLKREFASLYLAIFVFSIFTRISFSIFPIVKYFFRDIPYDVMFRFEYIAVFLGPASYTMYVAEMENNLFKKIKSFIFAIPGLVFLVLDFTLPLELANRMVPYMQYYMYFIISLDLILILINVIRHPDMVSLPLLLTLLIVGLGATNDIMLNRDITVIGIRLLAPSFVVFAIAQTALLAHVQNLNQIKVEELNKNLIELNKAYYRFVPREFLDLLSKKDITEVQVGEWKSSKMAIMSADIRNFTAMSEKINEMQVFELLNSYLGRVAPIIRKHNGIIEKYLGDGIIAIFPDKADSALKCAVEMQEEMIQLRKEFLAKGFPEIKIGIGVHYGNVIIGTGGDKERMTEISLSDDIDIAVKTESKTKIYQKSIIATRQILAHASSEVKKENRKFDFMGDKILEGNEENLFCIYNEKTGSDL